MTSAAARIPLFVFVVVVVAALLLEASSSKVAVVAALSGGGAARHHYQSRTHQIVITTKITTSTTATDLSAYREQSSGQRRGRGGDTTTRTTKRRGEDYSTYDAFGDYDDNYDDDNDGYENDDDNNFDDDSSTISSSKSSSYQRRPSGTNNSEQTTTAPSSTFYSQKPLTDPTFSLNTSPRQKQFFQQLCTAAKITKPSRIQSLAWPALLRGDNTIVADQTGSGKTLAYLLPLLQKLYHQSDTILEMTSSSATQFKKLRTGSPRILILTPTAELADQIYAVCSSLSKQLSSSSLPSSSSSSLSWNFNPFVTTATGSQNTNIRDQIRLLQNSPVDVLISTPGRLATILRTKNAGLDLGMVQSMVLDEVDFLLVDETFGPQLRTVGVAVNGGGPADGGGGEGAGPQFIFVTATLPEDVLESIQAEFPNVTQLRGPGLHRTSPSVHQSLIDVSVPPTSNRDERAGFEIKVREMFKALRSRRCNKTLIFCNTVETCRDVENALKRKDKRRRRNKVWAYHNALTPEVRLKNLHAFSTAGDDDDGGGGEDDGLECILVCTDRAARGIDFDASPIDHVLLFDFPKDPAEYVRRVGRTARAGRAGASTVLAYGWQLPIARKIMGLSGAKGKDGKIKTAKLDAFTMMKSSDGWDEQEKEDQKYMKGGAKKRMETAAKGGGGSGGDNAASSTQKKKKTGDKTPRWKKI
jgi:ATP-dependent RNA helicase DDX18/HAS1